MTRDDLNLWLSQQARLPAVLGIGLRYADRSSFVQPFTPDLSPNLLDAALHDVADVFQVLQLHHLTAGRIRWGFAHMRILAVRRTDGICLGIFTGSGIAETVMGQVEGLADLFDQLSTFDQC